MQSIRRINQRSLLLWNGFAVVMMLVLFAYGKLAGLSPSLLVKPPPTSVHLYPGFLTHVIQVLCAVPPTVCLFSFSVLRYLNPHQPGNYFLLGGAAATGGFLANEILRIHVVLGHATGLPKWGTVLGFAVLLGVYWYAFRDRWRTTPYGLLIAAGVLFILAFAMDLRLLGTGISDLFEGVPKFFSILNYVLYFWLISQQALLESERGKG